MSDLRELLYLTKALIENRADFAIKLTDTDIIEIAVVERRSEKKLEGVRARGRERRSGEREGTGEREGERQNEREIGWRKAELRGEERVS